MKFFVPDWDDRVDPGYDFRTDRPVLGRDPYRDDVYAHELLKAPIYHGVLLSRSALDDSSTKRARMEEIGAKRYLRMPAHLELLGDCGAFGYIAEKLPRYDTAEIMDYYERLGFDYGVSVDHLVLPEFESEKAFRFELTLRNAEEFLQRHRAGGFSFHPIGVAQGWDVPSYIEASRALIAMGYTYIAVGGLARSNTATITQVLTNVVTSIPAGVRIHVFGVARLTLLPLFERLQIASADSAAPIRQAWLSDKDNYYTLDRTYAAIRIPAAREERAKPDTLIGGSATPLSQLMTAERIALDAVRAFDKGQLGVKGTMDAIVEYDQLLQRRVYATNARRRYALYQETLRDRPWKCCPCEICRELGIEVILFRGNNRNRRRGFHNVRIVRQRIDAIEAAHLAGEDLRPLKAGNSACQLAFETPRP